MKISELRFWKVGVFLAVVFTGSEALRDVRIKVPLAVIQGEDAVLHCYYDLESDQLYTVKWYWYSTEFYRFTPNEQPPIKQFRTQPGLTVREVDSNDTSVVLEHVPRSVSGRYSCEVSADAPSFYTLMQTAMLQVVNLPKKDPFIDIKKKRYRYGHILKATCTSEHSTPAVNLTWYVNGEPAEAKYVNNSRETHAHDYTAHSVLRMKITEQSVERGRLKIRCVASMYNIYYRSNEKSIELERKRHNHHPVSTTDPPVQWELIESVEQNPKVRYVYNTSGCIPIRMPTITISVVIYLLLLR